MGAHSEGSDPDSSGPGGIVFHLAIPTHDLEAAADFYGRVLGAEIMRRYEDRITVRFFEHQVVCHLHPDAVAATPELYPRHFGITFVDVAAFDRVHARVLASGHPLLRARSVRWPERAERHATFFLADPSNNVLEFKHYDEPRFRY